MTKRQHFQAFLAQYPEFDFLSESPDSLPVSALWAENDGSEAINMEAVLEYAGHLQSINNLHDSMDVKLDLIEKGYTSSVTIFQNSSIKFAETMADSLTPDEAGEIYKQARHNYILLGHLMTALKTSYGSEAYQALKRPVVGDTEGKIFENIPSYQEIFGSLDYCRCPHCKSIFGPAAYFVDLMRICKKHIILKDPKIAVDKPVPLKERRRDLFDSLTLTCANTNELKPYLEIVNGILESYIKSNTSMTDLYKELPAVYYPGSLPFHLPLEQTRQWLKQNGVFLGEMLEAWRYGADEIAREDIEVAAELYGMLEKPLNTNDLLKFLGLNALDLTKLSLLNTFAKTVMLDIQDLYRVFEPDGMDEAKKPYFINQGFKDSVTYLYVSGGGATEQIIKNLDETALERLCRFIRLSKLFGLSYEETDWLLRSVCIDSDGKIPLAQATQIIKAAKDARLTIYQFTALITPMKDYGKDNLFEQVFGMGRSVLEKSPNMERVITQKLGMDTDALHALKEWTGGELQPDATYRHCLMAKLLQMRMPEYLVWLGLACVKPLTVFTPLKIKELLSFKAELTFNAYQAVYILRGEESPYVKPIFSSASLREWISYIREKAPVECRKDAKLLSSYILSEEAGFLKISTDELEALLSCALTPAEKETWPARLMSDEDIGYIENVKQCLSKWLCLLKSGISVSLISQIAATKECFGISDTKALSMNNLCDIMAFHGFTRHFGDADDALVLFAGRYAQGNKDAKLLSEITGWPVWQISELMGKLFAGEKNVVTLIKGLTNCFSILKKLGADTDTAAKLLSMTDGSLGYDTMAKLAEELTLIKADQTLRSAVEVKKRDVLIPLALMELQKEYSDITTPDKLYKYFLIDVEMDDKTQISRVKEGINAVQLYLQRCRMRLERGIASIDIPSVWWSWIMNYPLWEANRKIFVYPENYLLPSIRHSKSKLFKDVEEALQQSQITDAYIEEQYIKYLDDYFQLTQLVVCGAYATDIDNQNVLFLFGRTQQEPYTYYFCKRIGTLAWGEWQKIDASIDSIHMTPIFIFNRLHIFWTSIKENSKVKLETGAQPPAAYQNVYSLEIKYTYLNLQGKWIMPQTLVSNLVLYAQAKETNVGDEKYITDTFKMDDSAWKKLTLLRLSEKNLNGFIDKDGEYECLAIITGPFIQNLNSEIKEQAGQDIMEKDQAAYKERLATLIRQNNFEALNQGDGYLNTGFFKLFNEDLEEEHLIQKNEFYTVDGYIAPAYSLLYTPLYDEIHNAVGAYLSQNILMNGALPTTGILPHANNTGKTTPPKLTESSFIVKKTAPVSALKSNADSYVISAAQSKTLFDKLKIKKLINSSCYADEGWLTTTDLLSIVRETFPASKDIQHQVQEIQKILLKNIGAVYLFTKAQRSILIPVVNQPGSFIYNCGDEAFLVYPVNEYKPGKYEALGIRKTDRGTTLGMSLTPDDFEKMGFYPNDANQIMEDLRYHGYVNNYDILRTDKCTREYLAGILSPYLTKKTEDEKKAAINRVYANIQNYPIVESSLLNGFDSMSLADINMLLKKEGILCDVSAGGGDGLNRISLSRLKESNDVVFANTTSVMNDADVREVYKRLSGAVSSVHFNYRLSENFPEEFKKHPFKEWKFGALRLTNPTLKKLKRKLEVGGVASFLNLKTQSAPNPPIMPFDRLGPTANVVRPAYTDGAQVDFSGLYGEYNWELFYHIPMTLAESFSVNALNETAMKWFHYIFNPTADPNGAQAEKYYWNFKPFTADNSETLREMLENTDAIEAYNASPFDPHAIARLRIGAYEKYTVIRYVDNIIQWGDRYFTQNTWESLTSATMMYVWANDLLGARPREITVRAADTERTFQQIDDYYAAHGGIPQFIIDLEKQIQRSLPNSGYVAENAEIPFNDIRAYFGVPENEQMLRLWDVIEDRLYKIRNSLDIGGAPRVMPLFEPPVDVLALAKAASAAGGGTPGALTRGAALYPYRFTYMIEQAKALANQLIQLGSGMLSALEKKDAEALALLANTQERSVLQMTTSIKEGQVAEIGNTVNSLKEAKKGVEIRRDFYKRNAEENISDKEKASLLSLDVAATFQTIAGALRCASGVAHLIPQVGSPFAMKFGGLEVGLSLKAVSDGFDTTAIIANHISHRLLTMAQYERRRDEWHMQRDQAEHEINNLEAQIQAAGERKKMAEKELAIHSKTIEHKNELLDYLGSKFSNAELYQWLLGRLSSSMWQTYQLALELALASQEAYVCERDENANFIRFDYWENGRKGLMAGEGLHLALSQMQQAYLKKNTRRLEIEKNISMALSFPEEFEALKRDGICEFHLSEDMFARDYPACYNRKIASIALSVPAVLPPYQTVKALLKQTASRVLLKADKTGIDYLFGLPVDTPDEEIVKNIKRLSEKVAVSRGIDDSGLFSLRFEDERYLPFEGTGADSSWVLEMPQQNNQFELRALTDIIITVRYTALEEGRRGKGSFEQYVSDKLKEIPQVAAVYLDASQVFYREWEQCAASPGEDGMKQFRFDAASPLRHTNHRIRRIMLRLNGSNAIFGENASVLCSSGGLKENVPLIRDAGEINLKGREASGQWQIDIPAEYFSDGRKPRLEMIFIYEIINDDRR